MKINHLYKQFLQDKNIYQCNVEYWKQILKLIIEKKTEDYIWIEPKFANGDYFYDGNPIVQAICQPQKKSIRIIQEEPENNSIEIGAWLDNFQLSEGKIFQELVISLELSSESQKIAEKLIKKWIIEDFNNFEMSQFIDEQISLAHQNTLISVTAKKFRIIIPIQKKRKNLSLAKFSKYFLRDSSKM